MELLCCSRLYHLLGVMDALDLTRGKKLSILQINVRPIFSKLCFITAPLKNRWKNMTA